VEYTFCRFPNLLILKQFNTVELFQPLNIGLEWNEPWRPLVDTRECSRRTAFHSIELLCVLVSR
jgi:hypothetical protein